MNLVHNIVNSLLVAGLVLGIEVQPQRACIGLCTTGAACNQSCIKLGHHGGVCEPNGASSIVCCCN